MSGKCWCCSMTFFSCFSCFSEGNTGPRNNNANVTSPSSAPPPSIFQDDDAIADSSAIPVVVKQDDPRPQECTSGSASSSTVQALDSIHKYANAFEGGENVDVDLDRLINHISDLLELIKNKNKLSRPKQAYPFWPAQSESINKVKDFLSDAKDFVREIVPGDAKKIIRGLLQAMGTAHLAAIGLLVVSSVLERFEDVSNNGDACFRLLKEMIFLAKIVKQIKERPQLAKGMHDEVKDATELILEGSIMCCSQMSSSKFSRFFSTTVNKEELIKLTQQLDVMYKHIYVQMGIEIYDANQCKTASVSRLYPNHAVGIEEAIREVIDILEWGSEQNALAVILHGFGGMGKTTLAQAVFSRLEIKECKYSKVELFQNINSCPNILELQKKILKDLIGEKIPEMGTHQDGQMELSLTLSKVPAFIYIDNVLGVDELRQLLPEDMSTSKKVRVLMTARDLNVGKAWPMKTSPNLYPIGCMSSNEAVNLLQNEIHKRILDSEQVSNIIDKCGGIPLLLKLVAGALRVANDKTQVTDVVKELENLKGEDFGADRLEPYLFVYDKLPKECKDPFLDICSFFHGWDWDTVADIVGKAELKMLESRALVTKDTHGVISVHDIILALGCQKSEGVRYRFSTPYKMKELLDDKEEKDIQAIKGIWISANKYPWDISASKLDLMSKSLRVLAFESPTKVNGECSEIFKKLIFFKAEITRLPFHVSKLKVLKYLNYKPKDLKLSEIPSSLKHVEFDGSLHGKGFQISSTDLHHLKNLRILKLIKFAGLKNLPEDMGDLVNGLHELCLTDCQSIEKLPKSISKLLSLKILRLNYCYNLTELPEDLGSLNSLRELHLQYCLCLKALPDSVEKLSSLKVLELPFCQKLLNLPTGLGYLTGLVKLDLFQCSSLESIPESIRELKLLQPTLDMSGCRRLTELARGFCNLSFITHLSLAFWCTLEKLPDGFGELTSLRVLNLTRCEKIKKLPDGFGQLKCLEELVLKGCSHLEEFCNDFRCLSSLENLDLSGCLKLQKLPECFGELECLKELVLKNCSHLRELCNDFHCLSSLQNLDLSGCLELQKLPANFHCLLSLQQLYVGSCHQLEGRIWMDHLVMMKRLQRVHIKGSEQLVNRWAEIQREGHQSWSFVVTAGQALSMSEVQMENIEKTLLSDFDRLLTSGRGEPFCLSDHPPDTVFFVVCDVKPDFQLIDDFPWRLIEETVDEIQRQFQIIYIGPHFSELPKKVQDSVFVGHMSATSARKVLEKVYLTLDADKGVGADVRHCFQMYNKMVGDDQSDKYLASLKLLTRSEVEECVLGNCRRYLRLKQLTETTQQSNIKLLRELFAPEGKEITHVFQKHQSDQDQTKNAEPLTCGVDKLEGKNIILEMRPAHLYYDIRLSSMKEMYVTQKDRFDLEIVSIPIVEPGTECDAFDVYERFSREVPWFILQNSWTIITRVVKFFMVKQCGWEGGDASEKCYTSIIWMIESNGKITVYEPSVFCKLDKWEVLFGHLESVSYQVRWGTEACPPIHEKIEELTKNEWKQLSSMSTLDFIFNHLESVSAQVKEIMFQGKLICLYSGSIARVACSLLNSMVEVRDSIHIIHVPQNMKTFNLTDNIKKYSYYPWGNTVEMEGMSLLNLSGNEVVRFWMRLLHLKEEISEMDDTDKQLCEMRKLLNSFPFMNEYQFPAQDLCMIFMYEDGKIAATCRNEVMRWLFLNENSKGKGKAKRLIQLLIKISMEEGKQMHQDSNVYDRNTTMQPAIIEVDEETVDLDLDDLSKYTTDLLEHQEIYQLLEFNKEGEKSTRPKARHHWPTSIGFTMLKSFLLEGVNANWVKDIIYGHSDEDKWKTVTKRLLKELGETHWASAGLLMVADVLDRFETVSAQRNECLFVLDEMNRLAIYLKQFNERRGLWTGMKREATGSIVRGCIICCAQIDPSKFAMFGVKTTDLYSCEWEIERKCNIMADTITKGRGSESASLLKEMCYHTNFVIGDLASENEDESGPS